MSTHTFFEAAVKTKNNLTRNLDEFYEAVSNPNIPEETFALFCHNFSIDVKRKVQNVDWDKILTTIPLQRLKNFIDLILTLKSRSEESFLKAAKDTISHIANIDVATFVLQLLENKSDSLRCFLSYVALYKKRALEMQQRLLRLQSLLQSQQILEIFDGSVMDPLIDAIYSGRIDLVEVLLDFLLALRGSGEGQMAKIYAQSFFGIETLPERLFDLFVSVYTIKYPLNPKIL